MIKKSVPVHVPKTWGYELWFANDAEHNYCGKILHIHKGQRFSMHFHQVKTETFYVLSGTVKLRILDLATGQVEEQILTDGETVEIPRMLPHQLEAFTEVDIIEASTYHHDADSYRVWR